MACVEGHWVSVCAWFPQPMGEQMNELEREIEGEGSKWRSQVTAARDEADRQRKFAYEMQVG